MSGYTDLYEEFKKTWHSVYHTDDHIKRTRELNIKWKELRRQKDTVQATNNFIQYMRAVRENNRAKGKLYFSSLQFARPAPTVPDTTVDLTGHDDDHDVEITSATPPSSTPEPPAPPLPPPTVPPPPTISKKRATPKQDQLEAEYNSLLREQRDLLEIVNRTLSQEREINHLKKKMEQNRTTLQSAVVANKKLRTTKKQQLLKLQEKANEPRNERLSGRPSIECLNPGIIEAIYRIVEAEAGVDLKRRSEFMFSLDQLHAVLLDEGFVLSRSGLYLRLIPKCWSSHEGQRHVHALPIKLAKAQRIGRTPHVDDHFTKSSVKQVKHLASILGPSQCLVISLDDKAKVNLGVPACTRQTTVMMSMEYKIKLPDHDFVVAAKHKLIPSVYSVLTVKPGVIPDGVTYSGETLICTGKHDSSTAGSHYHDYDRLLKHFPQACQTTEGEIKPVIVELCDNGPDEAPRHEKTLVWCIMRFLAWKLDCLMRLSYAPGQSFNNPCERRMAPLSFPLSGMIFSHDHHGSHLNSSRKTVDSSKEKANFQFAGNCLAGVWNGMTIDDYPVTARYIPPPSDPVDEYPVDSRTTDPIWRAQHVRLGQYFIQIMKCTDSSCCSPFRSQLPQIMKDFSFLPPPCPYIHSEKGISMVPFSQKTKLPSEASFAPLLLKLALGPTFFPGTTYDEYIPSFTAVDLQKRTCAVCGQYFPTINAKDAHTKMHKVSRTPSTIRPKQNNSSRSSLHEPSASVSSEAFDSSPAMTSAPVPSTSVSSEALDSSPAITSAPPLLLDDDSPIEGAEYVFEDIPVLIVGSNESEILCKGDGTDESCLFWAPRAAVQSQYPDLLQQYESSLPSTGDDDEIPVIQDMHNFLSNQYSHHYRTRSQSGKRLRGEGSHSTYWSEMQDKHKKKKKKKTRTVNEK